MAPETPKGVSSRLLTMKFMQRAVASASSAGSPDSDGPSLKKRKVDRSPGPGRIDPNIDQALIQAALDDQEATRQAALEKHSAADTHWVLKMKIDEAQTQKQSRPLNIVYVGYGEIDSDDNNEDNPAKGRTSTTPAKQDGAARVNVTYFYESSAWSRVEAKGRDCKNLILMLAWPEQMLRSRPGVLEPKHLLERLMTYTFVLALAAVFTAYRRAFKTKVIGL
ncbi:hypothetical protein E4U53_000441 [Claviceps sorghi]|nr:hypothetical protein E4U53_000441 [Claviceps sorghi]